MDDDSWRTRVFAPKVKTGCNSCRQRRIKCDEQKPFCAKCTKSKRECVYRTLPADGKSKTPLSSTQVAIRQRNVHPIFSLMNSDQNRRFQYFKEKTVPEICGYFKTKFWSELCFQASFNEPAIRDGLLALSAFHESVRSKDSNNALTRSQRYIDDHYSRAIQDVANQPLHTEVVHKTLICCMIFFSLELYHNRFWTACAHVENGLRIMREQRHRVKLDERLEQMYIRMDLQLSAISPDRRPKLFEPDLDTTPDPRVIELFTTVEEARAALDRIRQTMHYFVKERIGGLRKLNLTELPRDVLVDHKNLEIKLKLWGCAFDSFCKLVNIPGNGFESPSITTSPISPLSASSMGRTSSTTSTNSQIEIDDVDRPSTCLLGIYHRLSTILVATLFFKPSEYNYAVHESYFDDIVKFATYIRDHFDYLKWSNPTNEAQFDMDVKPAIVFVIQNCTNSEITTRARDLLESHVMFPDDNIPETVMHKTNVDVVEQEVTPTDNGSPPERFDAEGDAPVIDWANIDLTTAFDNQNESDLWRYIQAQDVTGMSYGFPDDPFQQMQEADVLNQVVWDGEDPNLLSARISSPKSEHTFAQSPLRHHSPNSPNSPNSPQSPSITQNTANSLFLVDPAVEWWINRMSRILLSPTLRNLIWQQSRPKEIFETGMENKFDVTDELMEAMNIRDDHQDVTQLGNDMNRIWEMQ